MSTCEHLAATADANPEPSTSEGCVDCLRTGGEWVHLRLCLGCGHMGCCDSSPSQHASAHVAASGHPVVRSAELGESWRWCYADKLGAK